MNQSQPRPMSAAEFLEWEALQTERWELIDGIAFAMAGASDAHGTIVVNLAALLQPVLRGSPCRVFITDMKLGVPVGERRTTYPDAFITCDERDRADRNVKRYPSVIIEVLSTSTEADDRGDKFEAYRTIPTLSEYVLIDSRRRHIELHRRTERGTWELVHAVTEGKVELMSLSGTSLPLDDLYADVESEPHRRSVRPAT